MKWIAGLGNPGKTYQMTRHNIGFMAVDRLAAEWGMSFKSGGRYKADIAEGLVGAEKVALIKPLTFMNLSGEALRAFADYQKADPADLIVIYDDLDTPFGRQRLRLKGGPGGHNGIRSIISHLGTETFNRVRVGISRPEPGFDVADYVLSRFSKAEQKLLPAVLDEVCAAVRMTLDEPFDKVMAYYNGRDKLGE